MRAILSRLKSMVRSAWREANAILRGIWVHLPVRDRTVLYESYAGYGALCNPEAIFRYLLHAPDMADLHHTWVLNRFSDHPGIRAEFARNRRVTFVLRGSPSYFLALATRRYLVNNATFPPEFAKRPGQVYLNTWHGTPLKQMGYDLPVDGAIEAANTLRNFLSADYLLSQNEFMTSQMYERAYRLRGIFPGRIIQGGYPRTDRQWLDDAERLAVTSRLESAGIRIAGRTVVLYAPTWRGDQFATPENTVQKVVAATNRLQGLLGDQFVVLLKPHQVLHPLVARNNAAGSGIVPRDLPTNVILGIADILVTDFSSIFFDFLALPGPIVFYADDSDSYTSSRGTYFSTDELPGPFVHELEAVATAILSGPTSDVSRRREEWRSRFVQKDDGRSTERVVDIVFRGRDQPQDYLSIADDPRVSLLIHLGSMNSNGITSSALNLLGALDPALYDISVVFALPAAGSQAAANQSLVPPHIRQILRASQVEGKLARTWRRFSFLLAQRPGRKPTGRTERYWHRQWLWVFGAASFSHSVDFDGYGPFWASLLLNGPASTRSIWLHNDMSAEQHRIIRGRERLRRSLGAVFALYDRFDALVSVSPALRDLNRYSLAARFSLRPKSFLSARNVIDGQGVLDKASADVSSGLSASPGAEQPAWAAELAAQPRATTWFVSVGRLSTEKNHGRLIRAFAQVHAQHPATRLLIVGGGPLHDALQQLVGSLGLTDSVVLTGFLPNPFPAVALADCFVLSSDYEGQPMVIMEAAILGLPVIATKFATVTDALPGPGLHIVDPTDEALAAGMLDYLDGSVAPPLFDFRSYNVAAVAEFAAAIEHRADDPSDTPPASQPRRD